MSSHGVIASRSVDPVVIDATKQASSCAERFAGDEVRFLAIRLSYSGELASFFAAVSTFIPGIDPKLLISSGIVFPEEVFCFMVSS